MDTETSGVLLVLEGLAAVDWAALRTAGGSAEGVPGDLQQLASADPGLRGAALASLSGSIYHQGTLYSSTPAAVPFLMTLLSEPTLPDREDIARLLLSITVSFTGDPNGIVQAWAQRKASFGEIFSAPTAELARRELDACRHTGEAFLDHFEVLLMLMEDDDKEVSRQVQEIITRFAARLPMLQAILMLQEE